MGGDRLDRKLGVDRVVEEQRLALRRHLLVAAEHGVEVGARVVEAGQRGQVVGRGPVREAITLLRIGLVVGAVGGDAHEQRARGRPLGADAAGQHVLVVVVLAVHDVGAVAVVVEGGDRAADAERVGDGQVASRHEVALVVIAERRLEVQLRLLRELLRHVLDRAADRVAPVQRSLRAAQDLDALQIVDVLQRALRSREVHVVDVDSNALLVTGDRILLADAADVRGERTVRCARSLQRGVRGEIGEPRDVLDPRLLDGRAGKGAHRTRNVLDQLFAAPGGHDNLFARDGFLLLGGVRDLCMRLFDQRPLRQRERNGRTQQRVRVLPAGRHGFLSLYLDFGQRTDEGSLGGNLYHDAARSQYFIHW